MKKKTLFFTFFLLPLGSLVYSAPRTYRWIVQNHTDDPIEVTLVTKKGTEQTKMLQPVGTEGSRGTFSFNIGDCLISERVRKGPLVRRQGKEVMVPRVTVNGREIDMDIRHDPVNYCDNESISIIDGQYGYLYAKRNR